MSMARDGAGLTSQRIRDRLVNRKLLVSITTVFLKHSPTHRDTCLSMKRRIESL